MNQKQIVTKENIKRVANFLKEACEDFRDNDAEGCYNFRLNDNFVIACGWSDGYDMADEDIIKSAKGQRQNGSWTCGWAVNAGIKIRNDFDCSDYDYMNAPIYNDDSGEVWMTDVSMRPDMKTNDYKREARYFLKSYVAMVNALKAKKISIDF